MKTPEQILHKLRLYIVAECGLAIKFCIEAQDKDFEVDPDILHTAKIRLELLNDISLIIIQNSHESTD